VQKLWLLLVLGSLTLMAACGGGSASSAIISVNVSCSPSTILYGQTSQCSATVTGTGSFSSGVTWTASAGTISNSGLFTAPSGGVTALQVTITATSTQDTSKAGSATVTVNPSQATNNVQPITVDAGPEPQSFSDVDEAFTSVTVCVHGTNTCQTIDHIQIDTGSEGLRLISSVLTVPLPQENDSGGNPLDECTVFADGYIWGPVATADITIAGEKASGAPVQIIIPSSTAPAVPSSCSSQNPAGGFGNEGGSSNGNSVSTFGANGIIGVGLFQFDCGQFCVSNSTNPTIYYGCTSSGCTPTTATLAQQVPNPITLFATDNNGVQIQLPSVPNGGTASVQGSMIFGIGTQSNNVLGSANVYPVPDSGRFAGKIITTFNGKSYPHSFLDSGSNGLFFLDSGTTGIALCTGQNSKWYCPVTSPDNLSATNQGQDANGNPLGTAGTINFAIEDATSLFNTGNTAFSTLGAPNPGAFDWGLAFFFGRNVFTAIDQKSPPAGNGPYFAY
jgi:hypothetical protein